MKKKLAVWGKFFDLDLLIFKKLPLRVKIGSMIVLKPPTKVTTNSLAMRIMDEECTHTLPLLTNSK
jgi:hypothetical protein